MGDEQRAAVLGGSGWQKGEAIELQCPDLSSERGNVAQWDGADLFKCFETDQAPLFHYETEGSFYCGVEVVSQAMLDRIIKMMQNHESWHCRVPVSRHTEAGDETQFIPVPIPFWGRAENSHVLVSTHLNAVLHGGPADDPASEGGGLHGVALYPTREHFQLVGVSGIMNFHGPIKWFSKASFERLNSEGDDALALGVVRATRSAASMGFGFGAAMAFAVCYVVYLWKLRPRLMQPKKYE